MSFYISMLRVLSLLKISYFTLLNTPAYGAPTAYVCAYKCIRICVTKLSQSLQSLTRFCRILKTFFAVCVVTVQCFSSGYFTAGRDFVHEYFVSTLEYLLRVPNLRGERGAQKLSNYAG